MRFYGNNVVIVPDPNGTEDVRGEYMRLTSHTRQPDRTARDMAAIAKLPRGRYTITTRQYAGHAYTPDRVRIGGKLQKPAFVSETVIW